MPYLSSELLAALPRLRRYARVLTDDRARADEMVKETLARARQVAEGSSSQATVAVRLFGLLRSAYVEQFAPGRPRGPRESSSHAGVNSAGDASASNAPRGNELLVQLLRLPVEEREVLVLVAVERMSYEDVAALLAVPIATVLARLTQARESLRSAAVKPMIAPKNAG